VKTHSPPLYRRGAFLLRKNSAWVRVPLISPCKPVRGYNYDWVWFQKRTRVHSSFNRGPGSDLVRRSAILLFVSSLAIRIVSAATASQTLW